MDLFRFPVHDVFHGFVKVHEFGEVENLDHYASKRIIYKRHYQLVAYFICILGSGAGGSSTVGDMQKIREVQIQIVHEAGQGQRVSGRCRSGVTPSQRTNYYTRCSNFKYSLLL